MADKGYDGRPNFFYLLGNLVMPVIPRRKSSTKGGLYDGIYTADGAPTCIGKVPMKYIRTDPDRGDSTAALVATCRSANAGWKRSCEDEVWEKPQPLVWGPLNELRRNSP